MEIITSKSNEKVKYIKSLNEKKFRQKYGAFYLEGLKVVMEVIDMRKAIDIEFIAYSKSILKNVRNADSLLNLLEKERNIQIVELEENVFKSVVDTINPQGVLVVIKMPKIEEKDILEDRNENILIIDKVQDSGNLGTIIRSCDAFDVKNIVCINGTADVYSNKVTRSTMGSILRTKILYLDGEEVINFIKKLKNKNYQIIATSLNTNNTIESISFSERSAIIVGNEANGVSQELINAATIVAKIPMEKSTDSLNVGIATGILLYNQYKNQKNV